MPRRIRSVLPTCFVLLVFILPGSASAFDVWAFIEVNGSPLPGVNTVSNPEKVGGIPLSSFSQASDRRLGTTGLPTGTIEKGPITFTKAVDAASPLLFRALANNEIVNDALFKFFRRNSSGVDELYYEVRLSNGAVGKQNLIGGVTQEMEAIKLYFQTMEQTHPIAGTSHTN